MYIVMCVCVYFRSVHMVQSVHSQCMNITLLGGHSNITGAKFKDKFSKMFTSQGSTTMVLNLSWSIRPVHNLMNVFLRCILYGSGAFLW